jgi:hypothetical protein
VCDTDVEKARKSNRKKGACGEDACDKTTRLHVPLRQRRLFQSKSFATFVRADLLRMYDRCLAKETKFRLKTRRMHTYRTLLALERKQCCAFAGRGSAEIATSHSFVGADTCGRRSVRPRQRQLAGCDDLGTAFQLCPPGHGAALYAYCLAQARCE